MEFVWFWHTRWVQYITFFVQSRQKSLPNYWPLLNLSAHRRHLHSNLPNNTHCWASLGIYSLSDRMVSFNFRHHIHRNKHAQIQNSWSSFILCTRLVHNFCSFPSVEAHRFKWFFMAPCGRNRIHNRSNLLRLWKKGKIFSLNFSSFCNLWKHFTICVHLILCRCIKSNKKKTGQKVCLFFIN